jgi:chemotaxis protein CheX
MTAAVQINGDFHGGIMIRCERDLLRRAAAIMFDQPEESLAREDEIDVIGELANVVAGNLKALYPGTNSISLPTIIEGTDYKVSAVDVRSSDEYVFTLDGAALIVTVIEHLGPSERS